MHKGKFSHYLLFITFSLLIVACSSVPVDSESVNKPANAIELTKPSRAPNPSKLVAQKTQPLKPHKNLIKQGHVKQDVINKKVSFSTSKQTVNEVADSSKVPSRYTTTPNTANVGNSQQDKKTVSANSNKKGIISKNKIISPKKKPLAEKVASNKVSSKKLSDSRAAPKKTSKKVSKKVTLEKHQPKQSQNITRLPVKSNTDTTEANTVAKSSKEDVIDKQLAEATYTQEIKDKPYVPKPEGNNNVVNDSMILIRDNLLKEDVREKSDILASIEVSSSEQVDDVKDFVNSDNFIFDDVELDDIDKQVVGKEHVLFVDKSTPEPLDIIALSDEEQTKNIIKEDVSENDSINNSVKKSALLTLKEDVLNNLVNESEYKSEVFDIVKQANEIISEVSKKSITDSLSDNIQQFLLQDWRLFVPSKAQYGNSKFSHCFKMLDQMRGGQYAVQPPFKIDALNVHDWEQRLNGITFVQVSNVELELYAINENGMTFNAVSTVFGANEALSMLLSGAGDHDDQFFGLFAYSDSDEQSVGGTGRFYSIDKIKNLQVYLIKWDSQYYSLSIEKNNSHKVMEVIPLLSSQQQRQRNCRWRS